MLSSITLGPNENCLKYLWELFTCHDTVSSPPDSFSATQSHLIRTSLPWGEQNCNKIVGKKYDSCPSIGIQLDSRSWQIAESTCPNFQNLITFTPKSTTDLLLRPSATKLNADPELCESELSYFRGASRIVAVPLVKGEVVEI